MKSLIPSQSHNRKPFQVERIAFYSDAIIAIASTLLILEFKIPPLGKDLSWAQIKMEYSGKLLVPILGLIISFYSISRLWMKHHALFEHIIDYNKRLLVLNQFFLFFIMILPVSTSFVLEYNNPWFLRFGFYFSNLGLCNLSYYMLHKTSIHAKNNLSSLPPEDIDIIKSNDRSLLTGLAFLSAGILALFTVKYFYYHFILSALYGTSRRFHFYRKRLA